MTSGTIKKITKQWRISRTAKRNARAKNFAMVEKIFFLRDAIIKEVNERKEELGYYQAGHKEGGGSSNHAFVSDPTFQLAQKHIEPIKSVVINSGSLNEDVIKQPELWLDIIELTLEEFPKGTLQGDIIRARYLRNEPMAKTCIMLDIEPNCYYKYYNARTEAIQFAKECAIQVGLLKVI